jgi:hypothetical protein
MSNSCPGRATDTTRRGSHQYRPVAALQTGGSARPGPRRASGSQVPPDHPHRLNCRRAERMRRCHTVRPTSFGSNWLAWPSARLRALCPGQRCGIARCSTGAASRGRRMQLMTDKAIYKYCFLTDIPGPRTARVHPGVPHPGMERGRHRGLGDRGDHGPVCRPGRFRAGLAHRDRCLDRRHLGTVRHRGRTPAPLPAPDRVRLRRPGCLPARPDASLGSPATATSGRRPCQPTAAAPRLLAWVVGGQRCTERVHFASDCDVIRQVHRDPAWVMPDATRAAHAQAQGMVEQRGRPIGGFHLQGSGRRRNVGHHGTSRVVRVMVTFLRSPLVRSG